jgi:hypothetical protein
MDNLLNYIQRNPIAAVLIAGLLLFIAGLIVRRLRIISVVFILIAAFAFYVLLKDNKIGKAELESIKQDIKTAGKTEVEKIKQDVKTEVMKKMK